MLPVMQSATSDHPIRIRALSLNTHDHPAHAQPTTPRQSPPIPDFKSYHGSTPSPTQTVVLRPSKQQSPGEVDTFLFSRYACHINVISLAAIEAGH